MSNSFFFYVGLGMQLIGISSLGLCLFFGITQGDYGKVQLGQFLGGTAVFYSGHFLRLRASNS